MMLQRDKRLDKSLQEIGCDALSTMAAAELACQRSLTVEEVNALWKGQIEAGHASLAGGMDKSSAYRSLIGAACFTLKVNVHVSSMPFLISGGPLTAA